MKILLISDTHGKIERVKEVFSKTKGISLMIHLGDYQQDALDLEKELGVKTISVKGNMDGEYGDTHKIIKLECGNVLLTHGHFFNVEYNLQKLLYACEEHNCIGAFFGHTHVALNEEVNGISLINPGSITKPKDSSNGTYAVVRVDENGIDGTIMYYNPSGTVKSSPITGKLRHILNNSDRF